LSLLPLSSSSIFFLQNFCYYMDHLVTKALCLSAIPQLLLTSFHVLSSCCMISFLTHCFCGDPSHLLFTLFWIFIPYFLKNSSQPPLLYLYLQVVVFKKLVFHIFGNSHFHSVLKLTEKKCSFSFLLHLLLFSCNCHHFTS